jgi:hypothetical protein
MRAVLRIRKEPYYRRAAFEDGLKKVGFKLVDKLVPDGPESWLVIWNRQGVNEAEADDWEREGGTVIVCENGYLQQIDKTYYAISVHGHNGSGWFPENEGEDRFSKLGFELKPFHEGSYRLVCGQRGIGSRLMRSPPMWGEKLAMKLESYGLPVKFRPHPGNFKPKVPLVVDLKGASLCHIWSSASGVMALVEGKFVQHSAPHWICENPDREKALNHMAHGQWHFTEIATGEPFARIIENRSKAKW